MQIIAMITMLIDHVGAIFCPNEIMWRIIGRIAFPLYAYCIVIGYQRTKNLPRYFWRLFVLAAASQLPFMVALKPDGINAVAELMLGLAVIVALDRFSGPLTDSLVLIAGLALSEVCKLDYGAYGVLLVMVYRYTKGYTLIALHSLLNAVFWAWKGWDIEAVSILPTLLIVYAPSVYRAAEKIKIPRIVWRLWYPVHLSILALAFIFIRS